MNQKDFSKMSKEERHKALFEMPDEDIDYSDIPELDEEFLRTAKRVEHPLLAEKNQVRVRAHILEWFKSHAQERGYEALINDILETYVERQSQQS